MNLARSAIRSVAGYGVINVFVYGLSLFVQIGLANLLTPDIFGIVALAIAIKTFVMLILRWGIPQAIMQETTGKRQRFSTIFWINLVGTSVLALLVIATIPLLATFFGRTVVGVFTLIMLASLFRNLGAPFQAAIQRELSLPNLAMIDLVSLVVSGPLSIYLALTGWGVWSLALYYAIRDGLTALGHIGLSPQYPGRQFDWDTARWFYGFAIGMLKSRVLIAVESRGDDYIVGTVLGTAALGVYSFSWRLATAFHSVVHPAVSKGIVPTFSKLQDSPEESKRGIGFLVRMELGLSVPGYVFAALTAPVWIVAIFGSQWRDMVPVFQVLSFAGIFFPILATGRHVYYTWGQPRRVLRVQVVYLLVLLVVFAILLPPIGVIGAAFAVNTSLAVGAFLFFYELRKDVGLSILGLFAPRFVAGGLSLLAGYLLYDAVQAVVENDILMIGVVGCIVAVSFYVPLFVLDKSTLREDFSKLERALRTS